MNRTMRQVTLALLLACAAASAQGGDATVDKAVELFETRHLNSGNLNRSLEILTALVNSEPGNLRANYELAHVYYILGDNAGTRTEKIDLYTRGQEYAKNAIKINAGSASAHFWYLVNLGRVGQTKGVLNSLGLVPEIKKEIDKVLKLDPKHTGALDARAMLYYELPGFMGGSVSKSIDALNAAIALDSNYSVLFVDMGRCCIRKKDYEKARFFLQKVIEIKQPTYPADWTLDDKPDAEKFLKQIEGKQ
jgi:tetratricopeptide (TPR) repeat protein